MSHSILEVSLNWPFKQDKCSATVASDVSDTLLAQLHHTKALCLLKFLSSLMELMSVLKSFRLNFLSVSDSA